MRFTSLIVELIRARPQLVVWVVLLVQAVIWLLLPIFLYGSPPGNIAVGLAIGRNYQIGTLDGPPLAFWLADIAFRAAGNRIAGVYLLAQMCFILGFWALFQLGRAIVGGPHAVLAVLLTLTVTAFSISNVAFGPDVLAVPIWAYLLLRVWRVIGEGYRSAWFGLALSAGLLVLTTAAAPVWLLLVLIVMLTLPGGRHSFWALEALYGLLVFVVIVLPYAFWLARNGAGWSPPFVDAIQARGIAALRLLGGLLAAMTGIIVLTMMTTQRLVSIRENAPQIGRDGVAPLGRAFVLIFALAPAIIGCLIGGVYGLAQIAGGVGVALLLSGLAIVVLSGDVIALRQQRLLRKIWALAVIAPAILAASIVLVGPWIGSGEHETTIPAKSIAAFFGDSYERRTGKNLSAVAGDPQLAAFVAMGASRPQLLIDMQPARTPWLTPQDMIERGGIVLWRATDTLGTPPADIAQRFPGLVPEVPRGFDRLVNGRESPLRIGWAILRGK